MAERFASEFTIRFSQCDPAGIVYFARLIDMVGGCVEDWFAQAVGFDYREMHIVQRVGFPVVDTRCTFLRPCHLGERLAIGLAIAKLGRSSIDFRIVGRVGGEARFQAAHKVAMISLDTLRAIPIPEALRTRMQPFVTDEAS